MIWSSLLRQGTGTALSDGETTLDYNDLLDAIRIRVKWLSGIDSRSVALELDNGINWVLYDMACAEAGIVSIPIPAFFSESQRRYALEAAGVDLVLMDAGSTPDLSSGMHGIRYVRLPQNQARLPDGTAKITFTSGTTGMPKGVCLSLSQQLATARSLAGTVAMDRPAHLAILPLATLLENVAGVYAPLLCGGTVYIPSTASLGYRGSRLHEPQKLLDAITRFTPDSLIMVPELLMFLVKAVSHGWRPPGSLQFIAVGGARVSPVLLDTAAEFGLPVYQGYGLSECSSVVCLNTPTDNRAGSIGKPLPHVETGIINGELVVSGNTFLGYLGDESSWFMERCHTSDLVQQDEQGYFWFQGRRDNRIVSSFGRNINPEWPESELLSNGLIQQAVVLGDARPWCIAIVTSTTDLTEQQICHWLHTVNGRLPDYAQIRQCLLLKEAFTSRNHLYTNNGRPNRNAIEKQFRGYIDLLYEHPEVMVKHLELQDDLYTARTAVAF